MTKQIYSLNKNELDRYSRHGIAHARLDGLAGELGCDIELEGLDNISCAWVRTQHPTIPHIIIASEIANTPEDIVKVNTNGKPKYLRVNSFKRDEKSNSRLEFIY